MRRTSAIELVSFRPAAPRAYRVAGVRLLTDFTLPALRTYAEGNDTSWAEAWEAPAADGGERAYDGWGLIADGQRRVVCHLSATGYRLAVEGIATYWISLDGGQIAEVEVDLQTAFDTRATAALGAPLILALARRGIFCIHASVAAFGDRLVAFVGESGAGKSTLARYLDEAGKPGWRRIIDDTLPLAPVGDGPLQALPHFPQLKLPDEQQPSRLVPERSALSAIYLLGEDAEVSIVPTRPAAAAVALAAQTVASRLFGQALLAQHLAFCSDLALRLPVRRLRYPRHMAIMPDVRDALTVDLTNLQGV